MADIEYDWEVLEVINGDGGRGARVKYTPVDTAFSAIEKFVPIPWHKCVDIDHAREISASKITSHAPTQAWMKQIPTAADAVDTDALVAEINSGEMPKGEKRGDPESERREDGPAVSEPSGAEGDGE